MYRVTNRECVGEQPVVGVLDERLGIGVHKLADIGIERFASTD